MDPAVRQAIEEDWVGMKENLEFVCIRIICILLLPVY